MATNFSFSLLFFYTISSRAYVMIGKRKKHTERSQNAPRNFVYRLKLKIRELPWDVFIFFSLFRRNVSEFLFPRARGDFVAQYWRTVYPTEISARKSAASHYRSAHLINFANRVRRRENQAIDCRDGSRFLYKLERKRRALQGSRSKARVRLAARAPLAPSYFFRISPLERAY